MKKFIDFFSYRVDALSMKGVYTEALNCIKKRQQSIFFAFNIHTLILLEKSPQFHSDFFSADLVFADGVPVVWISRLLGKGLPERVSGTDLVEKLLGNNSLKIFLLGSNINTIKILKKKFKSISGYYCPPMTDVWNERINAQITRKINAAKVDILFVAAGSFKQEQWLLQHFKKTNATLGIGIGSALDILSGNRPRAPFFMKNFGLEWLWRLLLEPRRLWKRYLNDFFYLLFFLTKKGFKHYKMIIFKQ